MAIYIEIKTDNRVKEIVPHLLEIDGFILTGEIDSMNYGEGFDFKYKDLSIRLFDDERTDEVLADENFQTNKETYEEVFSRIVDTNKGETTLRIEIDRFDQNTDIQVEAADLIKQNLKTKKYDIAL